MNVSFNLQKSLSQVRQLIKRRQQSAKPGSNIQHMNMTNQYYEEIKKISKDLDMSQGIINADQLRQMNDYIDTVYQQEQQLINSEGRRNYLVRRCEQGAGKQTQTVEQVLQSLSRDSGRHYSDQMQMDTI